MYDPTVLQPPRASAGASVALLCLCALAGVAGIAVCFGVLDVVKQAELGGEVTQEQWQAALGLFFTQRAVYGGLCLLTGIFFMTWIYGAVKFARARAPEANTTSPAWAAWAFVLPIVNLIIPPKAAHAAYASCHGLERKHRTGDAGPPQATPAVLWAIGWVLMPMSGVAIRFVGSPNPFVEGVTAGEVRTFWYAFAAVQALTALTAAVAAVMVVKLTSVQVKLADMDVGGAADDDDGADLGPALLRAGIPDAGDDAPEKPIARPASAPAAEASPRGLPGMPPPPPASEEPRQFMPGIPPPPKQSEAA